MNIEKSIKHIEDRIKFSDLRPEIVIKKESAEAILSELENKDEQIELEIKGRDILVNLNTELSKELETWKKIAEMLARKGNFSNYHDKYCNRNIFDCKDKNPKKSCTQCIIDWARNEVEKDVE